MRSSLYSIASPFLDTEYDIVYVVQDKDVHLIQWMENDLKLPVV